MAQNRCSQESAFKILRSASSTRNMKLRDIATRIVAAVSEGQPLTTYFDE
jgi:AmiR/NasT family two-component response regulator